MSKLDLYYRAFKDYRKQTKNNIEASKERKTIQEANTDLDSFKTTKFTCTIEEDWVNAIEKGLEYVQKALDEERQFITVNGEIVDIEKVKKVSKTSVEHLAKHANLITHLPEKEGDDMIPDKLYITEKLNDYAVYENRFLYMLLRYLEDFIYFRIDKIEQLRATYVGDYSIHKEIKSPKREITYEAKVYERLENNPFPIPDDKTERMLERIRNCQSIVSALLGTFLMQEVSKAPMLKPPITKTNVLKMNNNFKNALALYEYISAYKGLGYTYEEVVEDFVPFNFDDNDELSESIALTGFLTYKLGNNLNPILEREYLEEERRQKEEEERKLEERIRRLKKKALESSKSLEEYMVMLEQRNQQLLHDAEELALARNEITKLNKEIDKLNLEKEELYRRIDDLNEEIQEKIQEIAYLNQKYISDMMAIREKHEREIEELEAKHQEEILQIDKAHQAEIEDLKLDHENNIAELKEENAIRIKELLRSYDEKLQNSLTQAKNQLDSMNLKVANLQETITNNVEERNRLIKDYEVRMNEIKSNCEKVIEEDKTTLALNNDELEALRRDYDLIHGQLVAMRYKAGDIEPCDEFTTRERFKQLERDFNAFEEFFKKQWKLTRSAIKKNAANLKEDEENRIAQEAQEKIDKRKAKKEELGYKDEEVVQEETNEEDLVDMEAENADIDDDIDDDEEDIEDSTN